MSDMLLHRYTDGPTACRPAKAVIRSIRQEIRRARALSATDVRLAARMGIVAAAEVDRPPGFNDGLFYPPEDIPFDCVPANRPLRAARVERSDGRTVRKLNALALMVDFPVPITSAAGVRGA